MGLRGIFLGAMAATLIVAPAASSAELKVLSDAPYAAPQARRLVVHSTTTGGDYVIVVSPPGQMINSGGLAADTSGARKLPAVYALDGGYGVAGPIAEMLAGAGVMSPAYVFSIGYPAGQDDRRNTDLLHRSITEGGATYGGGGAAFEAFLLSELKPYLERRYRLDPARSVLFGHSFGGVFAANVLADRPDAFSGYVIASAAIRRDPDLLTRLAAVVGRGGERRVMVAAGEKEDPTVIAAADQIAVTLSGPGSTFKVAKRLFPGESHISYYPLLAQAAYAWTLPSAGASRIAVRLPPQALRAVAGVYLYPDGRKVTVSLRDARLFASLTGMPGETELLAEGPRRFFVPGGFDVVFAFEGPADRPAAALTVLINGAESRAVRSDGG